LPYDGWIIYLINRRFIQSIMEKFIEKAYFTKDSLVHNSKDERIRKFSSFNSQGISTDVFCREVYFTVSEDLLQYLFRLGTDEKRFNDKTTMFEKLRYKFEKFSWLLSTTIYEVTEDNIKEAVIQNIEEIEKLDFEKSSISIKTLMKIEILVLINRLKYRGSLNFPVPNKSNARFIWFSNFLLRKESKVNRYCNRISNTNLLNMNLEKNEEDLLSIEGYSSMNEEQKDSTLRKLRIKQKNLRIELKKLDVEKGNAISIGKKLLSYDLNNKIVFFLLTEGLERSLVKGRMEKCFALQDMVRERDRDREEKIKFIMGYFFLFCSISSVAIILSLERMRSYKD